MLRIIFVFMFLFKFCWRGGKLTQIGDHPLAVGIDPLVINVDVTVPQYVSNSQGKGKVANIPQTPSGDQQISGRLKREIAEGVRSKKEYVNHESIYQFLHDPAQQDQKLWAYLPRRQRISHLVFAYKVPKIRAKETSAVQLFRFGHLPKLARKSTTLDNGSEHYLHTRLQEELGMQTYFADPYCSWQRGTNEPTNGLIRRYFPKGTDFHLVSQETVNEVVARLNSTPRKVLGYQTP